MDDKSLKRVRAVFTLLNLVVGWHLLYEGVAKILTPGWTSAGYLVNATGPLAGAFQSLAASPALLRRQHLEDVGQHLGYCAEEVRRDLGIERR